MKLMLIDMSNILHRTFYSSPATEDSISLAHHKGLMSMNKWFRMVRPDMTIAVFDRPNNWRKLYTQHTENRPSPLIYKGHRRQGQTPRQVEVYRKFTESVDELHSMLRDQTRVVSLAADGLEADDLIAGVCQMFPACDTTVISRDGDFIQLLRNPNVKVIDPATETHQSLEAFDNDADFFMFQKCCTGDAGDNVMRIFPKVYKTKVREYYTDELKRVNAFNEAWVFKDHPIHPGRLFDENKLLMDLTAQPEGIRDLIEQTIVDEMGREKSYNQTKFWRFCGKHQLQNIAKDSEAFARMFTSHP